ncbi:hypothetical protein ECE50_024140 [Chitinophaga sp. Mgbs1]|uniref:Uncharacterized protein n=1 Tax=Chitinophaga solisilvae TaxID=1233460 RepID=A0A433W8X4_9BACT|nr:hypothetical protein [Chitinophaga solisilvae]
MVFRPPFCLLTGIRIQYHFPESSNGYAEKTDRMQVNHTAAAALLHGCHIPAATAAGTMVLRC